MSIQKKTEITPWLADLQPQSWYQWWNGLDGKKKPLKFLQLIKLDKYK